MDMGWGRGGEKGRQGQSGKTSYVLPKVLPPPPPATAGSPVRPHAEEPLGVGPGGTSRQCVAARLERTALACISAALAQAEGSLQALVLGSP